MNNQAFNPYLPLNEYVPDGEPYVFDGRVYIYGSHDYAGGTKYCPGDYVSWSAPIDDLGNWKYEGVSYRKTQDPSNSEGKRELWAPDIAKGVDGRYYLYYCFSFLDEIGVAVSDKPSGPFEFYGHIKYNKDIKEGKTLNEHFPFDPGVLVDDDGKVYLYYGFSPAFDLTPPDPEVFEEQGQEVPDLSKIEFSKGAMVVELENDMLTMKGEPVLFIPGGKIAEGTEFEGHAFFEAASMRKRNGKYYFVYSSQLSHELCYAISDYPNKDFKYGGTIVSNGDIGYKGNEKPVAVMGNNHGSIVEIDEKWYVFYHRHTHGTESSRQGCAEKITFDTNGKINQVEITSCGMNNGNLEGKGTYFAAIACNLISKAKERKIVYGESNQDTHPYIFEENENLHYISNISDGVKIGYKYFDIDDIKEIGVVIRGKADGEINIAEDINLKNVFGKQKINLDENEWTRLKIPVKISKGKTSIFFGYNGKGALEFKEFSLN